MITGREFLKLVKNKYGRENVKLCYRFPIVYLTVENDRFINEEDDLREQVFASSLNITINQLRTIETRLFLNIQLRAPYESSSIPGERGEYWLKLLTDDPLDKPQDIILDEGPRIFHFYGHKGGQARSTVLSFLARALADKQWHVLAVDVDAEAPSLDALFGAYPPEAAATLVGARAGHNLRPYRVYTGSGNGLVDLVAFQEDSDTVDLDSAALAMELALSPSSNDQLVHSVREVGRQYDAILVDHRSGLGATIPPWVQGLPGPIIVFARMDGQWQRARSHLAALWSLKPRNPGLLVSFKPDDEPERLFVLRHIQEARGALECLADAMSLGLPDENELVSADDIADHWIIWPYDPAFRGELQVSSASVGAGVRQALQEMERILGLAGPPRSKLNDSPKSPRLHPSGAQDEGEFIVTRALRDLTAPSSPFWFVTGRKGTGKTRLAKELAHRGHGLPLLVADGDLGQQGIDARNSSLALLMNQIRKNKTVNSETFWWTLLVAANTVGTIRQDLIHELNDWTDRIAAGDDPFRTLLGQQKSIPLSKPPRVFLIDGLETSFPREEMHAFVGALFRVWSTIESDEHLRSRIGLRIFIRTDLANRGFENFEQLSHGRMLELRWNTQYILNFALSRIRVRPWFWETFSNATQEIDKHYDDILQGALDVGECERILLMIFPERLRRLNMLTSTFLRTWFTDDPRAEQGFYPRIYDKFLGNIADPPADSKFTEGRLEDGAISQNLIFFAHECATEDFFEQVKVELQNLVELSHDQTQIFVEALRGTITPFNVEDMEQRLSNLTGIPIPLVRQALQQMKALGVFENRPGFSLQWRAGRLFKTSLGMVYNRNRKS